MSMVRSSHSPSSSEPSGSDLRSGPIVDGTSHAWVLPDPPELIRLEAMQHVDAQGQDLFTEVNLVLCHEQDFFVIHLPTTAYHLREVHRDAPGMYRDMWEALVASSILEQMNVEQRNVIADTLRFYDWASRHQQRLNDTAWAALAPVLSAAGILSSLRRLEQQEPIAPESLIYNFTAEVSRLFPDEFPPRPSDFDSEYEEIPHVETNPREEDVNRTTARDSSPEPPGDSVVD